MKTKREHVSSERTSRALIAAASILVLTAAAVERAEGVTLTATDAGFVTEFGGSAKGDGTLAAGATFNYSVGKEVHFADGSLTSGLVSMDRNNYFVFDLSGLSGTIVGASLELFTGIYESVDPSETFDVVAPLAPGLALADITALAVGNSVGPSEFDMPTDLLVSVAAALYGNIAGTPAPALASAAVSTGDDLSFLSVPFVDLAYLNSFVGSVLVLGGTVPTADPAGGTPQQPFGFTGPDIPGGDPTTPTLVLTFENAPAPGTGVLMGLGLLCAAVAMRRRAGA